MDGGDGCSSRKGCWEWKKQRAIQHCQDNTAGERKRQKLGVKDKQGLLKTEAGERLQLRWVEHFSEILNRDVPMNPVEEDGGEDLDEIEQIDLGKWRIQEVKSALKMTKRGKAAGVDEVGPDLLRADMEDTASRLTGCYNTLQLRG